MPKCGSISQPGADSFTSSNFHQFRAAKRRTFSSPVCSELLHCTNPEFLAVSLELLDQRIICFTRIPAQQCLELPKTRQLGIGTLGNELIPQIPQISRAKFRASQLIQDTDHKIIDGRFEVMRGHKKRQ